MFFFCKKSRRLWHRKIFAGRFLGKFDRSGPLKILSFLRNLPLVAIVHKIVALRGALPEVEKIEDIKKLKLAMKISLEFVGGDFYDKEGEFLGIDPFSGRPRFGRDYFFKIMNRLKKKILIRSHWLGTPPFIFKNKCLTIYNSSVYKVKRVIAIYDFKKPLRNVFRYK
jgi:hypothetical protein